MLVCTHKCVSGAIWSYLEVSGAIWKYLELSRAIWKYLELSRAICSCLELAEAIILYYYILCYYTMLMGFSFKLLCHTYLLYLLTYFTYFTYGVYTICSFAHTNAYLELSGAI